MGDRRQYTGTQRLQLVWSVSILLVTGMALALDRTTGLAVSLMAVVASLSLVWVLGLGLLGFRERARWNSLVERSSFERQMGPHTADLEAILDARSITVSTTVPGVLSQTHTELATSVSGVEASFTVTFEYVGEGGAGRGLTTGTKALDEQFVVEGSPENVSRLLSPDVQSALLDVQTPGVCTVTGDAVTYDVPFTSLTSGELNTIASALVAIASRVEDVGRKAG